MDGNNAIIEAEIANTSIGKDVQELIRGKFVEGLSIRASKAKMKKVNIDGQIVNDVLEMELMGVDLVTNPGVKGARVLDILESAEHSGVYISIEEEEIVSEEDKMDYSKITLEELKKHRNDLIESLKEEVKPVFESEFKVNELKESVDNLTVEKTDLATKVEEAENAHKALQESFDNQKKELEEAQEKLQEIKEAQEAAEKAAEKAKLEAHVAESISALKFADSIKEKIKDKVSVLESVEEIDAKIAEEVEFLNMVIKESTGVDLSGKGKTGDNGQSKINEDEEFRRMVMES
jgi:DNA repair exonuclease SbcCD ATPase subunit